MEVEGRKGLLRGRLLVAGRFHLLDLSFNFCSGVVAAREIMRLLNLKSLIVTISLAAVLSLAAFAGYWHLSPSERTCNSCHEIRSAQELWAGSAHRNAPCADCHGTVLSNGYHSLRQNGRRVLTHFTGSPREKIRLSEEQVIDMLSRCRRCHEREYAGWLSSGHSASYSDIFLNDEHNSTELVNEDCLRCHGMFFAGTIHDVVTPVSTKGPWRLIKSELKDRPAIPCLACHRIHLKGSPAAEPDHSTPKAITYKQSFEVQKPSLYDRREKDYFDITLLPQPRIKDGERDIAMATDTRQRLCYQCHAPGATHEAGTSDDRTPRGIHEGLSCLSCHAPHSMEVRRSCAECHPRLSNCGLDVEKMDTSYAKPDSRHNVHSVACADCHSKGVPPRRPRT